MTFIFVLTREDKSHIFKPPCNVLFIIQSKQKIVKFHSQNKSKLCLLRPCMQYDSNCIHKHIYMKDTSGNY